MAWAAATSAVQIHFLFLAQSRLFSAAQDESAFGRTADKSPTCPMRSLLTLFGHSLHKKMDDEEGYIGRFAVKRLKWPMPIHRRLLL